MLAAMNKEQFWKLIEKARGQVPDTREDSDVAGHACALLARCSAQEITAAQQTLWHLMADSYQNPLWAAAYVVNGGCSDDGFDYFRGWLIAQGCTTFERVLADPDTLAELPGVHTAAAEGIDFDCEDILLKLNSWCRLRSGADGQAGLGEAAVDESGVVLDVA